MKGKVPSRRLSYRSVIPTVLVAGVLLPLLFIRMAFLALDAGTATLCPSSGCLGWRIRPLLFGGSDTSLELVKEINRVYLDAEERGDQLDPKLIEDAPESWDRLLAEMAAAASYKHVDVRTILLKTKAMLLKMDHKIQLSRHQASIYQHLASIGIPKSVHCVNLRLSEEYLINSTARSSLPPPEYSSCLTNASYIHIAILTDNILAASVAVFSAVRSSVDPEKLVFHIVTDKKTYNAMHAWFALNPIFPAIVEVKGLHQFDRPSCVSATVTKTVKEINRGLIDHRQYNIGVDDDFRRLEALSLTSFSVLNHLRIHLPVLFPKLKRVILLDDDVVVQRDLAPLWDMDLNGNIIGAVGLGEDRGIHCLGRKLGLFLNFSNPSTRTFLPPGLEKDRCAWLSGVNIFNLIEWRRTNITVVFQQLLKLNRESGFSLWRLGWLPPALIAFHGNVHPVDHSWHLSGLGHRVPKPEALNSAAVLHFSGPRKPWLEIGFPELRKLWTGHLNNSHESLTGCRVLK